jgi:acyl carrier protein
MTRDQIDAHVREVFAVVLRREVPPGTDVSRQNEAAWDSLKHVEIMFAIEDSLDVTFQSAELAQLDSIEKIVAAVEARRAA